VLALRFGLTGFAGILLCTAALQGTLAQSTPIVLTAQEKALALSLGPWPPAPQIDKTNRVSGQRMAAELGRQLFRDPRLSPVGYIGCVTCHQPDRGFTDLKARAHGLADLVRNTPTVLNVGHQAWYGWGGSSDSLWMASIRPILDPREMDSNPAHVAHLFVRDPELAACYKKVFKESPQGNPERTLVNVGKALAAYQETLVTGRTPFDNYRDGLQVGVLKAVPGFGMEAQRGLKLFVGSAGCISCHSGPTLSDGKFHRVAADPVRAFMPEGDSGRLEGLKAWRTNPLNLLGRFNDDKSKSAVKTLNKSASASQEPEVNGQFRTPRLRNVSFTGPYLHDGRHDRLQDALAHPLPAHPPWGGQDVNDLTAFLRALADPLGANRPATNAPIARCP
jgi:cytochrome c peroxidase